ncbi:hypothetical protein BGZ92_011679 [Podila epicladia]|nr:hypothetical protein BGZ92_011679 [Podila epicladia]
MSRHFASLKCITTSSSQFTGAMTFAISIVVDTDIDAEISAQSHGVFEQLAQLTNLQRLRWLNFSGTVQHMSAADVEWVRTNLTHLTFVLRVCNDHRSIYQQPRQRE